MTHEQDLWCENCREVKTHQTQRFKRYRCSCGSTRRIESDNNNKELYEIRALVWRHGL
jgi:Zn finger protein HypA/HybF involved in hydrogenase expression